MLVRYRLDGKNLSQKADRTEVMEGVVAILFSELIPIFIRYKISDTTAFIKQTMENQVEKAKKLEMGYVKIFGTDQFFIELQNHQGCDTPDCTEELVALAKEIGGKDRIAKLCEHLCALDFIIRESVPVVNQYDQGSALRCADVITFVSLLINLVFDFRACSISTACQHDGKE